MINIDKEKLKNRVLDITFCMLYCFMLYFITYMIKYEEIFKSIGILIQIIEAKQIVQMMLLSYIIILATFITIKSIVRDNFKSLTILTVITLIITIISYYKYRILEVPFIPNDIFLVGNVVEIANFGLAFPPIHMILGIAMLITMLVFYYKIRKTYYVKTKMTLETAICRVSLFIIGLSTIFFMCVSPDRFMLLKTQNELGNNYGWYGGNATFLLHLGDFYAVTPKEYNKEKINEIKEKNENTLEQDISNTTKPNVIMIMNESFTDPNKLKNIEYTVNPLEEITKLQEEDKNCIIGNLVAPVHGGGTSLTEFEALTGMSSYYLEPQIMPYISYIRGNLNSIVRAYNNNDYATVGIHTYKKNFYNRKNVYKYLGFDKTIFAEDIENPDIKGGYISDYEFANQIKKAFEETKQSKFIFGVTMQNHMPYLEKPYEEYDYGIDIKSDTLTKEGKEELRNYVQGIYDGDKVYRELVEYLKDIEEPTILIMYGDHIPAMGYSDIFNESADTKLDYYTTPYIIWANYNIDYGDKLNKYMSSSALSLSIMEIAKIEIPWYLKEFRLMYKEYPAINNQLAVNNNNELVSLEELTEDEVIKNCRILQHDLLIKKKYIPIN